jgi:hypothetical protein
MKIIATNVGYFCKYITKGKIYEVLKVIPYKHGDIVIIQDDDLDVINIPLNHIEKNITCAHGVLWEIVDEQV